MAERRMPGLLLKMRGLGESDVMADFFTSELGRITAVVKGAKRSQKRFFGLLLTAHYLDLHLAETKSPDLLRLQAASLMAAHLGLRLDYRRFLAAAPVLELLLRATALHDPQAGALELALHTLDRLSRARKPSELASALLIFLTRLLGELGYGLQLRRCLHCGRPAQEIRHPRLSTEGGLVCGNCHGATKSILTPPGLVKGLAAAQSMQYSALGRLRFPQKNNRAALNFLGALWRDITSRDLCSLQIVELAWRVKEDG